MFAQVRSAVLVFVVLTILTGLVYPLVITGVAQAVFPHRANGSLILEDGKVVGSELIGQPFDEPKYFWSRPSATTPAPYNASSSTGSNLAIGNEAQLDAIAQRAKALRESDPANKDPIPTDLVTASASGLDPHISVAAAQWQISRVARVRRVDVATVTKFAKDSTQGRQFGILGEPVVNVLMLNLALDRSAPPSMAHHSPR